MSESLTVVLPDERIFMPVVITGQLIDSAMPEFYLSLAFKMNREMEILRDRDTAIALCAQMFSRPVLLFEVSLEDVALVSESTIANLALKINNHEKKLFKIESEIVEVLTIHNIMKFGFPIQLM